MEMMEAILLEDMRKISLGIETKLNKMMTQLGLTASQGYVLIYILEHASQGISSTQLHRKLGVSRATVSGLLKKLRTKGYLEFQDCEHDNRLKMIFVTKQGTELREILKQNIMRASGVIFADFSKNEVETMNELQQKILENLYREQWLRRQHA